MPAYSFLKAIVFDWAGTTIDHGSLAPAAVFQEIFRRSGVDITMQQAREPMGMAKRDHIAAILQMTDVSAKWQAATGRTWTDADIDDLYERFLPLQKETLSKGSNVIAGVQNTVTACREGGLKIGSSTGYTRELMEVVIPVARDQGYAPDIVLCSEDAPRGRPAPYLLYQAAMQLDVYPTWSMVKVDDTPVGIEAGRNAGCWTVGVTRTGNCVGLSVADFAALSAEEQQLKCAAAEQRLRAAGAHFIVESVAELLPVLDRIDALAAAGDLPVSR